jgi:uncharacterized membrane protein YedE/YeeE
MRMASIFAAGLLFGLGLAISGMINPAKVLNFLDLAGAWDPTLILVMAAALAVTFAGYRLILAQPAPIFAPHFKLPGRTAIDPRLITGAAIFGMGWGLSGLCPGPAIAGLVYGRPESALFVIAMAAGIVVARIVLRDRSAEETLAAG